MRKKAGDIAGNLWPLFLEDEVCLVCFREMSRLVDMAHVPVSNSVLKVGFHRLYLSPTTTSEVSSSPFKAEENEAYKAVWCSV